MSRPRLAAIATLLVVTGALAAFLVLGSSASTQPVSASEAIGSARNQPITGKLSKPGYTVIALARSGRAKTVRVRSGRFRLRPPAKKVTLHLRAPDGTYAGPVVVAGTWNLVKVAKKKLRRAERKLKKAKARLSKASGEKAVRKAKRKVKAARKKLKQARSGLKVARRRAAGKEVVLGVTHGAALGPISVKGAAGYAKAKLKVRQWKRWVVEEDRARAKKGVPIGAGNFGRVRVKKLKGPSSDPDLDGIPNPLDVDDDGDLILDDFDAKNKARALSSAGVDPSRPVEVAGRSSYNLSLPETVNANVSTSSEINGALSSYGKIGPLIENLQPDPGTLPELDCAADPQVPPRPGLTYCSEGGTGRLELNPAAADPNSVGDPFPACCDPDGDGFGSLTLDPDLAGGTVPVYARWLRHGATNAQIHTGDLFIVRAMVDGVEKEFPGVVTYVFATVPTLKSYSDEAGNSRTLSYPIPPGGPGTPQEGLPVADGPDADTDVEVTLNFWRPQRPAAAGEQGEWTDIGKIVYVAGAAFGLPRCPADAYSDLSSELAPYPGGVPVGHAGLQDTAADRPPNSANTFSFKLNLTKCVDSVAAAPPFDNPGDETQISVEGTPINSPVAGGPDQAQAAFWFERQ